METNELEPDYQFGELVQLWQARCAWLLEPGHLGEGECLIEGSHGDAVYRLNRLGWRSLEADGWVCPVCAAALAEREGSGDDAT